MMQGFSVLNHSEEHMPEFDSQHTVWEVITDDGELYWISHQSKVAGRGPECMAFKGVMRGDHILAKSWGEVAVSHNSVPRLALQEVMSTILDVPIQEESPEQIAQKASHVANNTSSIKANKTCGGLKR